MSSTAFGPSTLPSPFSASIRHPWACDNFGLDARRTQPKVALKLAAPQQFGRCEPGDVGRKVTLRLRCGRRWKRMAPCPGRPSAASRRIGRWRMASVPRVRRSRPSSRCERKWSAATVRRARHSRQASSGVLGSAPASAQRAARFDELARHYLVQVGVQRAAQLRILVPVKFVGGKINPGKVLGLASPAQLSRR